MLLVYRGEIQDIQLQQVYAWYVFVPHQYSIFTITDNSNILANTTLYLQGQYVVSKGSCTLSHHGNHNPMCCISFLH